VDEQLHTFLRLALSCEWSASRPSYFTSSERGGWVGPGAGLDAVAKRKIVPCWESNSGRLASSPVTTLSCPGSHCPPSGIICGPHCASSKRQTSNHGLHEMFCTLHITYRTPHLQIQVNEALRGGLRDCNISHPQDTLRWLVYSPSPNTRCHNLSFKPQIQLKPNLPLYANFPLANGTCSHDSTGFYAWLRHFTLFERLDAV
jgi:hypothetical protein